MKARRRQSQRVNLRVAGPLVLCGVIGCGASADKASATDGGSSIAADCYDASHEGKGTVSFDLNGRTVQLAATAEWVMVFLDVGAHDESLSEGWSMELTPTDVGAHACELSSGALGMFYTSADIGSHYSTVFSPGACTINVRERIPHFKADFEATVVNQGDAGPPTLLLQNGQIDVEMPGWCY